MRRRNGIPVGAINNASINTSDSDATSVLTVVHGRKGHNNTKAAAPKK